MLGYVERRQELEEVFNSLSRKTHVRVRGAVAFLCFQNSGLVEERMFDEIVACEEFSESVQSALSFKVLGTGTGADAPGVLDEFLFWTY